MRLLDRSSRGVRLTASGKTFLEHAKVVLADVERARLVVRESASVPSGEAYSGFLREWLQSGRLDLAILYGDKPESGLSKRALLEEQLVFVTGAQGAAKPAKKLALDKLARWPLVLPSREHGLRRIIDEACAPLGLQLQVVAETDSLPSVKSAAEEGIGGTILPLGAVAQEIAAGKLQASKIDSPGMTRRVVCATSVTRPATLASTAVTALAQEVIHRMVLSQAWPGRWIGSRSGA